MEPDEIVEEYEKLKKLHTLPDFKAINHVFEISAIEDSDFLLRMIRRKIVEKIKNYVEILEDLIHPNTTVSALHECKYFSDDKKKKISELYSRLMGYCRQSELLDLILDGKKDVDFINEIMNSWESINRDLMITIAVLTKAWKEDEKPDESILGYFG